MSLAISNLTGLRLGRPIGFKSAPRRVWLRVSKVCSKAAGTWAPSSSSGPRQRRANRRSEMDPNLQRFVDEAEIRQAHIRYCRGIDRMDWGLVRSRAHA